MKLNVVAMTLLVLGALACSGCAKTADPKRPVEKIQKEAMTMSNADLEMNARLYAAAIRAEKAAIMKIQDRIRKMPVDQVFNNKGMTRDIARIGRRAEALFVRYRIYVKALQEKGGDLSKVQIEPGQPLPEEAK
jgi:hypothetical protein